MIPLSTILKDTALALVACVVVAFVVQGAWGALGAFAVGLTLLGNLGLMARLIPRLTAHLAGEDPAGAMAGALLVVKFPLLIAAMTGWAVVFGPLSVGLGMAALVLAVFLRGCLLMFQPPSAADNAASSGA
jgi:hypothetical protein